MSLVLAEGFVHKNRGLKVDGVPMVRLTRVDLGTIHMKTKTKVGPVEEHIAEIPKDECVSRLLNWRKLMKSTEDSKTCPGPDSHPRKVGFVFDRHRHGVDCDLQDWQVSGGRSCPVYLREIASSADEGQLLMALVWVDETDPQEWDSQPSEWPGHGWVPFYVAFRPKDPAPPLIKDDGNE